MKAISEWLTSSSMVDRHVGGGDYNRLRGIWGWHWLSCGMRHCEGGLIAIFRGFFATIGEIFSLAGGLGPGLSFYGV